MNSFNNGSAMQKIRTAAEAIRRSDSSLSEEQSTARALRANPALYNQYLAENPAQTGRR